MPLHARHAALALIIGPFAYLLARRPKKAIALLGLSALALALYAYLPYLQIFSDLNTGAGSFNELMQTAIAATHAWLLAAPTWAPGALGVVLGINLYCAVDLLRTKPPTPTT